MKYFIMGLLIVAVCLTGCVDSESSARLERHALFCEEKQQTVYEGVVVPNNPICYDEDGELHEYLINIPVVTVIE